MITEEFSLKAAILPRLPKIVDFLEKNSTPLPSLLRMHRTGDDKVIAEVDKYLLPYLLETYTGDPESFGKSACTWLDAGGECGSLDDHLKKLIARRREAPVLWMRGASLVESPTNQDVRFGLEFFSENFIRFINHPAIPEKDTLRDRFSFIAGQNRTNTKLLILCGIFGQTPVICFHDPKDSNPCFITPVTQDVFPFSERYPEAVQTATLLFERISNRTANNGPVRDAAQAAMHALQAAAPGR